MLRQLTSRQLVEWMAYFETQPFGQDYSDMVTAQVASILYNSHRGKGSQPMKASDFMPQITKKQSPQDMQRILRSAIAASVNR